MNTTHLSEELILQFIFHELTEPSLLSQVKEHLSDCSSCHNKFKDYKNITLELKYSPMQKTPDNFVPDLMSKLPPLPLPKSVSTEPLYHLKYKMPLALLAALLFFFGGTLFYHFLFSQKPSDSNFKKETPFTANTSLSPNTLGLKNYLQLVSISKNKVLFQDETGKSYSLENGKELFGFRLIKVHSNQVWLQNSSQKGWFSLREQDFISKSLLDSPKKKEKIPEKFSPKDFLEQLKNFQTPNKQPLVLSKEIFHYFRKQEFEALLKSTSTENTQSLLLEIRDEAWWWTHWLKEGKDLISFQQYAQKIGSTPESLGQAFPKIAPELRKNLSQNFPSLEFSYQVASALPPKAIASSEEWVEILASHYNESEENTYFTYLNAPQAHLKEWTYQALIQQDAEYPHLFERLVLSQLKNEELSLWEKLHKHPRREELAQWLTTEKESLALQAYYHLGKAEDLPLLFSKASTRYESLKHKTIEKIVNTQDCVSILVPLIQETNASEEVRIAALYKLIQKEKEKANSFLYELITPKYSLSIRKLALIFLERFSGKDSIEQYLLTSEDNVPEIRILGSTLVLKHEREKGIHLLYSQLKDADFKVVQHAMASLLLIGEPDLSDKFASLIIPGQPAQNRTVLQMMARLLDSREEEKKQLALLSKRVKKYKNITEIPGYLAGFRTPNLEALGQLCTSKYTTKVRMASIQSLARIRVPRSEQILTHIAKNHKPEFGAMAIHSLTILAQHNSKILDDNFINFMDESQPPRIRYATAVSLKNTYQKEAIPILLIGLKDKRKEIVKASYLSLVQLTGKKFKKEKEWRTWWNKSKALNYAALLLRSKKQSSSLTLATIQKLFHSDLSTRNIALKEFSPYLNELVEDDIMAEQFSSLFPREKKGSEPLESQYPFEKFLQAARQNPTPAKIKLLQYLSGQSFEQISDFTLWWEIIKTQKK